MLSDSPFLTADPTRIFLKTDLILGLWDAFPVSPGHALLVPRRVVATWFDASPEEQQALTEAITTTIAAMRAATLPADDHSTGSRTRKAAPINANPAVMADPRGVLFANQRVSRT